MGYNTGLSGLSAASNDLDVIGNNIANANTVGFKSGTAEFADMYASSVATAVANQVGIGTQMTAALTGLPVPVTHAIEVVLLFRLITFWAPAAFGVLATRRLYKRKAL